MRASKEEIERACADQKYWQDFAASLGLQCYGFSYRDSGGFHDASGEHQEPLSIPGWLADRIMASRKG